MKARNNATRKTLNNTVLALVILNLCACASSNQVVSKRLIQKRKYTSGWSNKPTRTYKQNNRTERHTEVQFANINENVQSSSAPDDLIVNQLRPLKLEQNSQEPLLVISNIDQLQLEIVESSTAINWQFMAT